ncbi:hypothetical protein VCV18_006344 [Metarhizium anisopliae]
MTLYDDVMTHQRRTRDNRRRASFSAREIVKRRMDKAAYIVHLIRPCVTHHETKQALGPFGRWSVKFVKQQH